MYSVKSDEWDEITETESLPVTRPGLWHPTLTVLTGVNAGETRRLGAAPFTIGRARDASLRLPYESVSRRHCRLELRDRQLVLTDTGSANGTFLNGVRVTTALVAEGDKIAVGRAVFRFALQDELDESVQCRLYDAAIRDDLTGLYNRRYFRDRLDAEIAFARRQALPVSLVLMDLDYFKRVNDEHGHPAGDEVLAALGARLRATGRDDDLAARIGGDELAVCARATNADHAFALAERLRSVIADAPVRVGAVSIAMTVSLGVATFPADGAESGPELFAVADRALYRAKRDGRNLVGLSRPSWTEETTR
jgi:diguanylate cyclase (GGDEF)-like protein